MSFAKCTKGNILQAFHPFHSPLTFPPVISWNDIRNNYLKYYILVAIAERRTKRIRGIGWTSSVQHHWPFTWLQLLRNGVPFGVCWDLIQIFESSKMQTAVQSSNTTLSSSALLDIWTSEFHSGLISTSHTILIKNSYTYMQTDLWQARITNAGTGTTYGSMHVISFATISIYSDNKLKWIKLSCEQWNGFQQEVTESNQQVSYLSENATPFLKFFAPEHRMQCILKENISGTSSLHRNQYTVYSQLPRCRLFSMQIIQAWCSLNLLHIWFIT